MQTNPFLDAAFHIRWPELAPELIGPAIDAALAGAQAAIDACAARDPSALTYENTFLALEEATEELNQAWTKVGHLQSVADAPALREAHNRMLPKVSAFYAKIPLNAGLWTRLKIVAESPAGRALTGVHRRYADETVAEFRLHGADLPPEKKARLEALQAELAGITQKYSENVLDATNAWQLVVTDETKLQGLPAHAKDAARRNAQAKNPGMETKPAWRFTLHQPSLEPFMTYLDDDGLRREMWTAAAAVGAAPPHDNAGLIRQILRLRQEKSALLGKAHFSDLVLERRMAKTGAKALAFVEDLHGRVRAAFAREGRALEGFKARQTGRPAAPLAPWEMAYWAEKLRRERYAFDEELLRPYFPIDRVMAGLFEFVCRVFGLRVVERAAGEAPVWHPEVKFYDMHDRAGRHVGSFYADWFPRESKRGGAWMSSLITGGPAADGRRLPHLGLICGNLTPPAGERPALLTHREVETIFHEFGHLIHHLLGEVAIKSLNGTNVAWDFVELPSQIMENWCWERESLDLFARHYETGAPIPEELFQKMTAAKNFRSASATMRQLAFGKMDLELHLHPERYLEGELEPKLRELLRDYVTPTAPPAPTNVARFNHLFADPTGYASGYYSYKWAEVLDADAFTRFRKEGLFNARLGAEYVEKILSKGNSEDPMKLFVSFMGREPDLAALLARAGLAA